MIELQDIALNSKSPLSEVKEIFRAVLDLENTTKIIKAADNYKIDPIIIVNILKDLGYE